MKQLTNEDIADLFDDVVFYLQILGASDFKIGAYRSATFAIRQSAITIATASPQEITSIKGIGKSMLHQILSIIQKNQFPEMEEALAQIPESVLELKKINGLGPKKIFQLWQGIGVDSVEKLKIIIDNGELEKVNGFGKKTVESLKEKIDWMASMKGWHLYAEADKIAIEFMSLLKAEYPAHKWRFIHEMGRMDPLIKKIDILTDLPISSFKSNIIFLDIIDQVQSKMISLVVDDLIINLFFVEPDEYDFQYFKNTCTPDFFQKLKCKGNNFESESKVFENRDWPLIPVIQRDTNYYESIWPNTQFLIETKDVKGLIHCHTTYSDGENTLLEMANYCIEIGLEYMVVTDHSVSAFYANGLSEARIKQQHQEIDQLNKTLAPFKIFKSIECDILTDGQLDYSNEVLSTFDLVIASIHTKLEMTSEEATNRLIRAIENPYVKILGHSSGRVLLKRKGYDYSLEKIVAACKANHVAIEINANPRRLDIDYIYLPYVLKEGVKVSINPDAHSLHGINDIKYGVYVARKGGLTANHNISSLSLKEFCHYNLIN